MIYWHLVHLYCCTTITTIHLQNSFHLTKLKLCPVNNNSSFSPPRSLGNHHSTFCLYEFDYSGNLISEIIQCLSLCDWPTSLIIVSSRFIHGVACQNFLPLWGWITFHCMYTPYFIYALTHRWTLMLLLPLGFCKWHCHKCGYINISLSVCFQFFWLYTQKWNCCAPMKILFFIFLRDCHTVFYGSCSIITFTFPAVMHKSSNFSMSLPILFCCRSYHNGYEEVFHCGFHLHFPNNKWC